MALHIGVGAAGSDSQGRLGGVGAGGVEQKLLCVVVAVFSMLSYLAEKTHQLVYQHETLLSLPVVIANFWKRRDSEESNFFPLRVSWRNDHVV